MEKVSARWNEKKDILIGTAEAAVSELAYEVYPSQIENFRIWNIMEKQIGEGNVDCKSIILMTCRLNICVSSYVRVRIG